MSTPTQAAATKTSKGLLGKKLGMTQVWDENNKLIPVTVVQADSNVITQRLGDLAGIDLAVADLNGDIAISVCIAQLRDDV